MAWRAGLLALFAVASLIFYEAAPDTFLPGACRIVCAFAFVLFARARAAGSTQRAARGTVLALGLAGAADVLLVVSAGWPRAFLIAMGLFLAGHVALVVAFGRSTLAPLRSALTLAPLALYAIGVLVVLTPFLGALRMPVYVYVAALTVMAWRACVAAQDPARPRADRIALAAGGLLFVLADTLLAFDKFHRPIPHEKVLAMIPYWASLACFVWPLATVSTPHAQGALADASTARPPVAD